MNRFLVKTFGYVLTVPLLFFIGLIFISMSIVEFAGDVMIFAMDKSERVLMKMKVIE